MRRGSTIRELRHMRRCSLLIARIFEAAGRAANVGRAVALVASSGTPSALRSKENPHPYTAKGAASTL